MLPIADDNSDNYTRPYVNYFIIAFNIIVFIFFQKFGTDSTFTNGYATVPAEILSGNDIVTAGQSFVDPYTHQSFYLPGLTPTLIPVWLTLFTSMFMHGGFAHLAGNMLFLWIFGDNIENKLGHKRYLLFYLLTGVLASLSHVFATVMSAQNSLVPCLGASGAISGVMGAYIILFPLKKVKVFAVMFIFTVPAFIALGFWILFQILNGVGLLGGEDNSSVAYTAHIGGFIAGILFIKLFEKRKVELYLK